MHDTFGIYLPAPPPSKTCLSWVDAALPIGKCCTSLVAGSPASGAESWGKDQIHSLGALKTCSGSAYTLWVIFSQAG